MRACECLHAFPLESFDASNKAESNKAESRNEKVSGGWTHRRGGREVGAEVKMDRRKDRGREGEGGGRGRGGGERRGWK